MDSETLTFLANSGVNVVFLFGGGFALRYLVGQIAEQKQEIQSLQERIINKETEYEKKQGNMLRTLLELTHKDSQKLATLIANNTDAINSYNQNQISLMKAVEHLGERVNSIEKYITKRD